ncbi:carboxymuconolactone decarboxylase family protein [Dyadobacter sp. 3J3]|uniref:carboxymuconolactone decarboxylase family protein n=1 Tax=Dyadobacter sp. 3J3 TaxID=2606600 RepID=UPI00135C91EC|nr:carboxymuconolactone decarboxylase family protein [Dyadobacter sp. 3J3]
MKTIHVPSYSEVTPEAQILFDEVKKSLGKVPNLYATMGYSPVTLRAFLDFEGALNKTVFSGKEREAIFLVVSEVNECNYCLAAHTMVATMKGYSKADTLSFRVGHSPENKLNAVLQLAKSITENKGGADPMLVDNFFEAGYNEGALVDLVGLITAKIFTNYLFAVTSVPVDFPVAEVMQ